MIARRGFLAGILGAPAMAQQAAEAVNMSGATMASGLSETWPNDYPESVVEDPFGKWLRPHRKRMEAMHDAKFNIPTVPYWIKGRKSWSPAFKQHVYHQELKTTPSVWDMDTEEIIAHLAKRGIKWTGV